MAVTSLFASSLSSPSSSGRALFLMLNSKLWRVSAAFRAASNCEDFSVAPRVKRCVLARMSLGAEPNCIVPERTSFGAFAAVSRRLLIVDWAAANSFMADVICWRALRIFRR